jgi:hypothetical protein
MYAVHDQASPRKIIIIKYLLCTLVKSLGYGTKPYVLRQVRECAVLYVIGS